MPHGCADRDGGDRRRSARISGTHDSGYVCDTENDGRLTYVRITLAEGGSFTFYDGGGFDGDCDPFHINRNLATPVGWRMCEVVAGTDPCTKTGQI